MVPLAGVTGGLDHEIVVGPGGRTAHDLGHFGDERVLAEVSLVGGDLADDLIVDVGDDGPPGLFQSAKRLDEDVAGYRLHDVLGDDAPVQGLVGNPGPVAPRVEDVGYEAGGYRKTEQDLARLDA